MHTPMVYLYNLESEKGKKIKAMCLLLKIRVRTVKKEEYGLELSVLTGQNEQPSLSREVTGFDDEMILMVHFTNAMVHTFLQEFRRKGIAPVALKAVLTQSNAQWDSAQLHTELLREHEAMFQGKAAHKPE